MQVFFIGSTDHRDSYYFHSPQHNGWVVADLATGKASLHNKLALIRTLWEADASDILEERVGLGQDGDKWLIDGDDLILLLRDYSDEVEALTVYKQSGEQQAYAKAEEKLAKIFKRIKTEAE